VGEFLVNTISSTQISILVKLELGTLMKGLYSSLAYLKPWKRSWNHEKRIKRGIFSHYL